MKKVKVKIKAQTITVEPLFRVGDRVMLKENLIIVEIYDVSVNKNKYLYTVFYPHLHKVGDIGLGSFMCYEDELEEKPIDYDERIFNAYIEYRRKYEDLLERLRTPSVRKNY